MTTGSTQTFITDATNTLFIDWFPDIIGCFGTIIILIAYILLQTRKLDAHTVVFSFLNLLGAIMILISLIYSWNLAAVAMEIAWATISGFGMFKILFPQGFKLNSGTLVKKKT